jgi:hypothetical protein
VRERIPVIAAPIDADAERLAVWSGKPFP